MSASTPTPVKPTLDDLVALVGRAAVLRRELDQLRTDLGDFYANCGPLQELTFGRATQAMDLAGYALGSAWQGLSQTAEHEATKGAT